MLIHQLGSLERQAGACVKGFALRLVSWPGEATIQIHPAVLPEGQGSVYSNACRVADAVAGRQEQPFSGQLVAKEGQVKISGLTALLAPR